jgi:hypothetical protein
MIKRLFTKPSAEELAQRELDEAKRLLLDSQRTRDYHQKMVEFHQVRISSLTKQLKESANEAPW